MARLEDLAQGAAVRGILPDEIVTVVNAQWYGSDVIELTYKCASGRLGNELVFRDREPQLEIVERGRPWSFDGDGGLLRLVSEAYRIHLTYLFDPLLAIGYAASHLVPQHLREVRERREETIRLTMAAVKERLTKEINHWDNRAIQLREQERAGKQPRMNSEHARRRADDLQERLQRRMEELEQERQVSAQPPVAVGGALIVPLTPGPSSAAQRSALPSRGEGRVDAEARAEVERLAMEAVMAAERGLGRVPRDVSRERLGYDIESREPGDGRLAFIEVKGRQRGAETVTVTKNEILTALNTAEDFVLALVEVDGTANPPRYLRKPPFREPGFEEVSVNFDLKDLLGRAEAPR